MYLTQRGLAPLVGAPAHPDADALGAETLPTPVSPAPPATARLGPNVTFVGLTSLVTDTASEMVTAILEVASGGYAISAGVASACCRPRRGRGLRCGCPSTARERASVPPRGTP